MNLLQYVEPHDYWCRCAKCQEEYYQMPNSFIAALKDIAIGTVIGAAIGIALTALFFLIA